MKLTYVSHACLLMEHESACVVTDPWFNGPAYLNQWHVFPRPVSTNFTSEVTHIILTHGHEDHLHIPTLKLMNKNANVYFPYTWSAGTKQLDIVPEKLLHTTYFSDMSGKEDKPENYANVIYELNQQNGHSIVTISQDNIDNEEQLEHMKQTGVWCSME